VYLKTYSLPPGPTPLYGGGGGTPGRVKMVEFVLVFLFAAVVLGLVGWNACRMERLERAYIKNRPIIEYTSNNRRGKKVL